MLECLEDGFRRCRSEGITPDVLDWIAERYNFTWRMDMDPDGLWGEVPKEGYSFLKTVF